MIPYLVVLGLLVSPMVGYFRAEWDLTYKFMVFKICLFLSYPTSGTYTNLYLEVCILE